MKKETDTLNAEAFIESVNVDFKSQAISFITDIYKLGNRSIPDFENIGNNRIMHLYSSELNNLNEKLMWSRNVPLPEGFVAGLCSMEHLPKSTRIILKSILNNNPHD